ncbi:hypothetical protein CAPTEDRAFT_221879 [Capitella teleta]|uniref:EGF-like domain-containing protein n=1 Tax=Capitella teleta TaxID=283909 RepID=R7UZJ3_CAPTE|nr:hypothetical protein CAPTEDRAFT_221879 [Capitella teleta]|eukprot:ELU09387.1 hypothetical protein CAPTEDRAFT_221879 [Capitella teleta]
MASISHPISFHPRVFSRHGTRAECVARADRLFPSACSFPNDMQGYWFINYDGTSGQPWALKVDSTKMLWRSIGLGVEMAINCDSLHSMSNVIYYTKSYFSLKYCQAVIPTELALFERTQSIRYPQTEEGIECPFQGYFNTEYEIEAGSTECVGNLNSNVIAKGSVLNISTCYDGAVDQKHPLKNEFVCMGYLEGTAMESPDNGHILLLGDFKSSSKPIYYCARYTVAGGVVSMTLYVGDATRAYCPSDQDSVTAEKNKYVLLSMTDITNYVTTEMPEETFTGCSYSSLWHGKYWFGYLNSATVSISKVYEDDSLSNELNGFTLQAFSCESGVVSNGIDYFTIMRETSTNQMSCVHNIPDFPNVMLGRSSNLKNGILTNARDCDSQFTSTDPFRVQVRSDRDMEMTPCPFDNGTYYLSYSESAAAEDECIGNPKSTLVVDGDKIHVRSCSDSNTYFRPYQSTLTCIGVLPGREVDDTNGKWEGDYLVMSYLKEDSDRTEYVCGRYKTVEGVNYLSLSVNFDYLANCVVDRDYAYFSTESNDEFRLLKFSNMLYHSTVPPTTVAPDNCHFPQRWQKPWWFGYQDEFADPDLTKVFNNDTEKIYFRGVSIQTFECVDVYYEGTYMYYMNRLIINGNFKRCIQIFEILPMILANRISELDNTDITSVVSDCPALTNSTMQYRMQLEYPGIGESFNFNGSRCPFRDGTYYFSYSQSSSVRHQCYNDEDSVAVVNGNSITTRSCVSNDSFSYPYYSTLTCIENWASEAMDQFNEGAGDFLLLAYQDSLTRIICAVMSMDLQGFYNNMRDMIPIPMENIETTTVPTTLPPTTFAPTTLPETTPLATKFEQTTVASTTQAVPTTVAPTTQAVPTTVAPTTQAAPTTVAPTTKAAPTTVAPTTQAAPTTVAPTTQAAPTTVAPTTQAALTTVAPTTQAAPTTVAPTTKAAPTTVAPTTQAAPTTVAPTTQAAPTTVAPTTKAAPTTVAPTTQAAPTTVAPTTQAAPTTVAPTTQAATTTQAASSTQALTTMAPTTDADTTMDLSTAGETTVAPTTPSAPCSYPASIRDPKSWLMSFKNGTDDSLFTIFYEDTRANLFESTALSVYQCVNSTSSGNTHFIIEVDTSNSAYQCHKLTITSDTILVSTVSLVAIGFTDVTDCLDIEYSEPNSILMDSAANESKSSCPLPEGSYSATYSISNSTQDICSGQDSYADIIGRTIKTEFCVNKDSYEEPFNSTLTCIGLIPEEDLGELDAEGDFLLLKRSGSNGKEEYYCARYKKNELTGEISLSLNINDQDQASCDTSRDADFSSDQDGFLAMKLTPEDACWSSPCMNGGTCVSSGDSFSCLCIGDEYGRRCESVTTLNEGTDTTIVVTVILIVVIAVIVFAIVLVTVIVCQYRGRSNRPRLLEETSTPPLVVNGITAEPVYETYRTAWYPDKYNSTYSGVASIRLGAPYSSFDQSSIYKPTPGSTIVHT